MDNVTISIQKSIIKREFDLSIPRYRKGKDVKKGKKKNESEKKTRAMSEIRKQKERKIARFRNPIIWEFHECWLSIHVDSLHLDP